MTRIRRAGEFCWINILVAEPGDERHFFAKLFGWSYVDMPGMGYRIQLNGKEVGGLWDIAAPGTPPGTQAGIGVMVKVDDADAMSARAAALGGEGKRAFDIGEQGRMAECKDPLGAMFDLWQPIKSPGMTVDSSEHGAPAWFETMTTDVDRAAKFYTELFDWKTEVAPDNPDYTSFRLADEFVAGMFRIRPDMGPVPPHWGVYFAVNDTDETVASAVSLGARNFMPARDIPSVGRFAGIASPRGVHFFVIRHTGAL